MEKVLVTGVNGFVGQHLARELSQDGYEVVGIGGPQGNRKQSEFISEYMMADLMDPQALNGIDLSNVSGVIHLAGLAAVGPSFDSPLQYIETNIGMEINLFEAALRQNAHPKFVIVSSGSLYNPEAPLPLAEISEVLPNSPYAVSKLGQEQMAVYYGRRGFEIVIARPFNHIGPGQSPGFLVPDIAQQLIAVERGDAKEILVGNLDAKRDYTDVRDIARAYRLLLDKGLPGELYNICSGQSVSGHDILAAVLATSDAKPIINQDPEKMRPSDAPDIYGSHDKITHDTGWQPQITLERTISDALNDWRRQG